ncbi:hypothetical protein ACVXHA_21520 [Escherichia coli]
MKARGAADEEYEKTKAEVMDVLRGHFRPEFLRPASTESSSSMRWVRRKSATSSACSSIAWRAAPPARA